MIDIKSISGELLLSVPILEDAVIHEELMASDYVALSWSSESDAEIPAGAYIEHEGERYSLLEPYRPERADEVEYRYKPQFHSRVMAWDKQPACVYTYEEDGVTVKTREFDWSFVGSPADAMHIVRQAIKNEMGEEWSVMLSDSLPSSIEIAGGASSILAVLSDIANQCETEYWADKKNNVLHLSKCEHGSAVALTVGDNVSVPSVTSNKGGYFTRYYALGSTRNITQAAGNINGSVNKRLTLDPNVYPMGYKDVKGHYENGVFVSDLQQGEIFSNVVIFDDIYPSSDLRIYDVRPRLKYKLDGGNKVVIGGTEDAPVYDQYAVWYFKIRDFEFSEDLIIPNKKLSVHFKSGQLTGQEFELTYHAKASSVKDDGDVVRFEIEAGDYEILFKEEGDVILPSIAYLIPQEDDEVTLFNIEMPSEYTQSAMVRLEEALGKQMEKDAADSNTYEVSSNAAAFYEAKTKVDVGQKIAFTNGGSFIETRTLMVERKLDFPCQQKIRVGNNLIKGSTKELRENVESLNKSVDVIAAFNDLSKTIQEGYARTQAQINEALAKQVKMFYFVDDETIGTKYNFFSEKENSAGGKGESIGTSGGGGSNDLTGYATEEWVQKQGYATKGEIPTQVSQLKNDKNYLTRTAGDGLYPAYKDFTALEKRVDELEEGGVGGDLSDYATIQYVDDGLADKQDALVSGVNIKTINGVGILGFGNINIGDNGGGGAEGLTAINVNNESFQPDENGIVTLPDYPSALPNPKALTFGKKAYNGSAAMEITETDIISDIGTIRTKLESLENYDDLEIKTDIATLEGYFTNGKAKNADKLDGYDSTDFAAASSVNSLSETVTSLENDVADVKQDISDINGDITSITARVTKAEEDISENKGDIEGIGEDVTSLMTWYRAVGSKFSKDADGTIKMDGDFYTTGENSAGGVGESVGGTGGGIDTEELDYILNGKGYATETWVKNQGFATGTIPTAVSQLDNDRGYITSTDIPDIPDAYTKEEVDNLLAGYTTINSHNALTNIVAQTKIDIASNNAKITTNTTNIATNAANISVNSDNIEDLDDRMLALEEWFGEVGQYFKYDETNEAWYLDGNFYAKGENSANGAGEDIIDFAEVASRVAANETAIKALSASGPNLVINFYELKGLQETDVANAALVDLVGLTNEAVNGLLDARYNKVIGNGTYREVWNYTAHETASYIEIYLRKGYSDLAGEWYHLHYERTTQKWNITRGDI